MACVDGVRGAGVSSGDLFGIVGVGLVSLIILKFFRRTALQVVTNNELSKRANLVSDYNKKSRSTKSSSSRSKTSK